MNQSSPAHAAGKRRAVALGNPEIKAWREDGVWHVDAVTPLAPVPARFTDRLVSGAQAHPERTLVARRGLDGEWIRLSYAQVLESARRIGQALLERGLSSERPLVILSGNDLEHFQLALGAMYAGVPYSPLSPAYSLVASDPAKLRDLIEQLTPGAVFACDGSTFARAIEAVLPADAELILARGAVPGRAATTFASLLATEPGSIDAHNAEVGPET
ncbi:MAG: feruloyl-CoA synthase, partial [Candidatus Accumulibacter sp.]|nr:feruloyl-CoA synthase [Accumulibacter sp.]